MYGPYPYPPEPVFGPASAQPRHDPLAVAVGNASLLGVGYWLLRKPTLAIGSELITLGLVITMVASAQTWAEILVVVWWAATVGHGWWLAGRDAVRVVKPGQRVAAVAITAAVVLVVSLLRVRADDIGQSVADARRSGDCAAAVHALHGVWFGPRLVDAPLAATDDRTRDVCRRLDTARAQLTAGLQSGSPASLQTGFAGVARVLADHPDHQPMAEAVVTGFLTGLPTTDPCRTAAITDWLRKHPPSDADRGRTGAVVARTAPTALVGCADRLMATHDWRTARSRYQQLVAQYPHEQLATRARAGVTRATLALQLAKVHELLDSGGALPDYCNHPAPYGAAPPYRNGLNRALFYSSDEVSRQPYDGDYVDHVPRAWQARQVQNATLIVCAGSEKNGPAVQSCPYENKLFHAPFDFPTTVTFHKIAVPVRAYELRTGRRVVDTTVQIAGTSCPDPLPYTTFGPTDLGPPGDVYVNASPADVEAAFRPVFVR